MAVIKEIITNVDKDVTNWNPHILLAGMWNSAAALAIPLTVKCRGTIWPNSSTLRYMSKRMENTGPHKNLYMNAHCSMIHNSPKVETAQVSINWCGLSIQLNIYSTIKGYEETVRCYNIDEPKTHYAKWKKPVIRGHILWWHLYKISRIGKS